MKLKKSELIAAGITGWGVVSVDEIPFAQEFQDICRSNGCGNYNTSWACPPAQGDLETCKARVAQYHQGLVFNRVTELEDSFDFEGMMEGHRLFKESCDALYALAAGEKEKIHLLSNEGCKRCKKCTWPDAPCRFPELLFPAIEGYGIYVAKLAQKAGLKYINGQDTVTYFGMLLCKEPIEIEDEA